MNANELKTGIIVRGPVLPEPIELLVAAGGIAQTLAGRHALRAESLERVRKAMTKAGITFLPDDGKAGVGVRGRIKG
jgi:hypothetical protein